MCLINLLKPTGLGRINKPGIFKRDTYKRQTTPKDNIQICFTCTLFTQRRPSHQSLLDHLYINIKINRDHH